MIILADAGMGTTGSAGYILRPDAVLTEGVNAPAGISAHPLLWRPPSDAGQPQQQSSKGNGSQVASGRPAALTGFSTPQKAAMTSHDARCVLADASDILEDG